LSAIQNINCNALRVRVRVRVCVCVCVCVCMCVRTCITVTTVFDLSGTTWQPEPSKLSIPLCFSHFVHVECWHLLPRYLMVAVGCLYIKSGEAPARDILKDLVELCKGVRGEASMGGIKRGASQVWGLMIMAHTRPSLTHLSFRWL